MPAAKHIIILERLPIPGGVTVRVAFWLDVPLARQALYADANKVSSWTGASIPEVAQLKSGEVLEVVETQYFAPGMTLAQRSALLITTRAAMQSAIDGENRWQFYGSFYDGATWVAAGA